MDRLNDGFFFVADKIISLQSFFIKEAWSIGRYVFLISLLLAAVNYAISGQGLKENLIKIGKAVVFFIIIMGLYPRIIGFITDWTFQKAYDSTYGSIEQYVKNRQQDIAAAAKKNAAATTNTTDVTTGQIISSAANGEPNLGMYDQSVLTSQKLSDPTDPLSFFSDLTKTRQYGDFTYTVVAPAATLQLILLVAGDCFTYSDHAGVTDFGKILKGLLCALAVVFTGIFAIVEYLLAFLEFMLVSSVGIIMFPLSIWEGSRFLAEKLIGAIVGFFIKLLFTNICIFLLLYGFISLIRDPFTGRPDEIITILFVSILFFYICKSAPALAQSLLSGTPSLTAGGALAAAGGAIAAGASFLGAGQALGGSIMGGAAKAVFGGAGAISQAAGAVSAVKELGGGAGTQAAAFMGSMGGSAKQAMLSSGGDLARSLVSGGGNHGGGGSPGSGLNRHSQRQTFLNQPNADGTKQTFAEHLQGRHNAGIDAGQDYMLKQEQKRNANA